MGALSLRVMPPGIEADCSPLSSAEVKNDGAVKLYFLSPVCLHDMVLNINKYEKR
jgi:hypothetical protein